MPYLCKIYKIFIDPLLRKLRKKIASLISVDSKVIEIASGTGAQSLYLANLGYKVTGIDINEVMIDCAKKSAINQNLSNITYKKADGSNLNFINDKEYDYAIITLALHELNDDLRKKIINEMQRVSKKIIIADYNTPLPKNFSGYVSKRIEQLVGGAHYSNFKKYIKRGGLLSLLEDMDIKYDNKYLEVGSSIIIVEITSR